MWSCADGPGDEEARPGRVAKVVGLVGNNPGSHSSLRYYFKIPGTLDLVSTHPAPLERYETRSKDTQDYDGRAA